MRSYSTSLLPTCLLQIIGASRDKADEEYKQSMNFTPAQLFALEKETLLTVALATSAGVTVYTMCGEDCRGVKTYEFLYEQQQLYITDMVMLKSPDVNSVNYSSVRSSATDGPAGFNLVAVADDGSLVVWDMGKLRFQSEERYRSHWGGVPKRAQTVAAPKLKPQPKPAAEKEKDSVSVHSGHSKGQQAGAGKGSPTARERRKQSPSRVFLTADDSDHHSPERLHAADRHGAHHHHSRDRHPPPGQHHSQGHGHHASGHHQGPGGHKHGHHHGHGHDDEHHPQRRSAVAQHAVDHHGTHSGEQSRAHSQQGQRRHHDTHHNHGHGHHSGYSEGYHYGEHSHPPSAGPSGQSSARDGIHHPHHDQTAAGSVQAPHPHALSGPDAAKSLSESGATWVELKSRTMFPLPRGQKYPGYLKSVKQWQAHSDSIPLLVPMHAHGCLLTMSLDGYHRVWNLDKQCLGELALPNLTDQMKANSLCKDPGTGWRFILERIPVTKHHHDIAQVLVKFLKQTKQVRTLF